MDLDDDFLLAAYQDYLNEAPEWPFFEDIPDVEKYKGSNPDPMPLLIRECARLIPVTDSTTGYVNFHPLNMPNVVLRRINIVGTIVGLKTNATYKEIEVCDGTGTMTVLYKLEKYEEELKLREEINDRYGIAARDVEFYAHLMEDIIQGDCLGNTCMKRRKQLQEANKSWWEESRQGMLGKPLIVTSYVNVWGFCNLRRKESSRPIKNDDFWKSGMLPTLIFNAYKVTSISEKQYNEQLEKLVNGIVKMRYTDD